jgi:hypothetical protein
MLVTYTPTGENVEVGPGAAVAQALSGITSNPIVITTLPGYTPVEGTMAAGSTAAYPILGRSAGPSVGFYDGLNKTLLVARFYLEDATAVTTALAGIATELQAGTGAVTLDADGTVTAVA